MMNTITLDILDVDRRAATEFQQNKDRNDVDDCTGSGPVVNVEEVQGIPHVRGGEPDGLLELQFYLEYSPRAWG